MSERMSLDYARTVATGYGATTVNEQRAAKTIVAVGGVLDYLEASAKHKQEIKVSAYGGGYVDALGIAVRELRKALGEVR